MPKHPNIMPEKGRPPIDPAADPTGVAVESTASPLSEPASGSPVQNSIKSALLEFVRVLARAAASRDWQRAVVELATETDQRIRKDSYEP